MSTANINWGALVANIARSSLLNINPGSTIERDISALIDLFNKTAAATQVRTGAQRGGGQRRGWHGRYVAAVTRPASGGGGASTSVLVARRA